MVVYMAIVVYAPALALSQVTGFDVDIACAVIYVVCIFYTTIGGMKAVMWTDTFQAAVMFGSFLAIVVKGSRDVGGAGQVFDRNYQSGRVELFNLSLDMRDRHTVWGTVIGVLILSLIGNILNLTDFVSPYLNGAIQGIIIILAVILQRERKTAL